MWKIPNISCRNIWVRMTQFVALCWMFHLWGTLRKTHWALPWLLALCHTYLCFPSHCQWPLLWLVCLLVQVCLLGAINSAFSRHVVQRDSQCLSHPEFERLLGGSALFPSGWTIAGLRQENDRPGRLPSAPRHWEVCVERHRCLSETQAAGAGAVHLRSVPCIWPAVSACVTEVQREFAVWLRSSNRGSVST